MSTAPTVGDLRTSLNTERALLSADLPAEHDAMINAQLDTMVAAMGGAGVIPKDGLRALSTMSSIGSSEISVARNAQRERLRNDRIDAAVSAVDITSTVDTESAKFATLTSAEKDTARTRLAVDLIKKFAASSTTDVPTLMAQLDGYKTAGIISTETVEETKKALNERVADLARSIQADLDAGILTASGVQTRLDAIGNPALRDLVGAKFGEVVNTSKYSTEADGFLTPAPGAAHTTTAALDAALAAKPPAEAIGIRKALNEKVTKKAYEYRQLVATGHRSIEQIAAEINAMPDSVQKDLLLKSFAAEFSSDKMRELVKAIDTINPATGLPRSTLGQVTEVVNDIVGSAEFAALPDFVRVAYEKALDAKMHQSEGTHRYYLLKHNQQEAEGRLALQRESEIRRKQTIRNIKNYFVPSALIVVGLLGGIITGGSIGSATGALAGSLIGVAPGSIWLGRNIIAHGWDRSHRRETEAKIAEYAAQSQEAYNNIHNIDAERELMPIRYLNEVVKVAAEVSWVTQSKNSGLTRDEFIQRYMEDAGIRGLNTMADSLMNMNLRGNATVNPAPAAPK